MCFLIFGSFISRNHFLEGGFTFQWGAGAGGGGCTQIGDFIFKWGGEGAPHGGSISFDGGVEKNCRMDGGTLPTG